MPTYQVIKKDTTQVLYQYDADTAQEWHDFPFSVFDHVPVVQPIVAANKVYHGRTNLTHLEFRSLFTETEIRAIDAFQSKFETFSYLTDAQKDQIRTDIKEFDLATFVDLNNPKYRPGLNMYVQLGILTPNRVDEVMNG